MDFNMQARIFAVQSIALVMVLNFCCLLISKFWGYELFTARMISSLFVLVIDIVYALIWYKVVTKHRDMLPTFYTSTSGFRMLLAMIVLAVWYFTAERTSMLTFFCVFLVFYMVSLVHHSIYFSRISNRL